MVVTKRDLILFKKLASYGMLTTKQVSVLVFNSIAATTVLRRLRILEKDDLIKRILGLESTEAMWTLTDKGGNVSGEIIHKRNWNKNLISHDFKLLCLRLHLENHGIAKSWIPEYEIRSLIFKKYDIREAKKKLIPDGLMMVEENQIKKSVAIELELTLKNQKRIKEIILKYMDKKELNAVWYVASSYSILNSFFSEWESNQWRNKNLKLYGSLLEDVMKNPIEAKIADGLHSYKLHELWMHKPAQLVAQALSTPSPLNQSDVGMVSSPNHSRNLIGSS